MLIIKVLNYNLLSYKSNTPFGKTDKYVGFSSFYYEYMQSSRTKCENVVFLGFQTSQMWTQPAVDMEH